MFAVVFKGDGLASAHTGLIKNQAQMLECCWWMISRLSFYIGKCLFSFRRFLVCILDEYYWFLSDVGNLCLLLEVATVRTMVDKSVGTAKRGVVSFWMC